MSRMKERVGGGERKHVEIKCQWSTMNSLQKQIVKPGLQEFSGKLMEFCHFAEGVLAGLLNPALHGLNINLN